MKIVLDTNVIISGAVLHGGTTKMVMHLIFERVCQPIYNQEILIEYERVLISKFKKTPNEVKDLMKYFEWMSDGPMEKQSKIKAYDPDDQKFLDLALHLNCPLVSGNLKDYPKDTPIPIWSPSEFLAYVLANIDEPLL